MIRNYFSLYYVSTDDVSGGRHFLQDSASVTRVLILVFFILLVIMITILDISGIVEPRLLTRRLSSDFNTLEKLKQEIMKDEVDVGAENSLECRSQEEETKEESRDDPDSNDHDNPDKIELDSSFTDKEDDNPDKIFTSRAEITLTTGGEVDNDTNEVNENPNAFPRKWPVDSERLSSILSDLKNTQDNLEKCIASDKTRGSSTMTTLDENIKKSKPKPKLDNLTVLIHAFSIRRNLPKLFNISNNNDDLTCLHGIRFLSMTWVGSLIVIENAILTVNLR